MEALVYDDSPIAEILEGDAVVPHDTPQPKFAPPRPQTQYAPRGLPRIRDKLRFLRRTALSVASSSGDRFLERFRYSIVASQLLSEDGKNRSHTATTNEPPENVSLRGAASATALSFACAWVLHWIQCRLQTLASATVLDLLLDICFAACLLGILAFVARKQYLKFTRQTAASQTARLISLSSDFDDTIKEALRYIQEIEVVARGYDLGTVLPPISRLDGESAQMLCRELRRLAAKSLYTEITQFIYYHNELQPLLSPDDLRTYYHIYELSPDDFSGAVSFANDMSPEAQETLKQLRFLSQLHSFARKFFLVDLLALRTTTFWNDVQRWKKATHVVKGLADDISMFSSQLRTVLTDDEGDQKIYMSEEDMVASPVQQHFVTPERQQSKTQMRRFENFGHGVRALGARSRIARDDIAELIARDEAERVINATIVKHYDSLGDELRSLLDEWTRGRSAMMLLPVADGRHSRPLSEMRAPLSPSPSLGGLTMVDGSPADALMLLNGEEENDLSQSAGDEEVFEAVVQPRKRMSMGVNMSREEKIAKLKEGRQKRATLQEQTDNTTNMLRELQMVIKHRPQQRQSSRVTSI